MPAIRASGGGSLQLWNNQGVTTHAMTPQRVSIIYDFLISQDYITAVEFGPRANHPLNNFRAFNNGRRNLVDMHLAAMGLPVAERRFPWIKIDEPRRVAEVIIWRTPRWHSFEFPWDHIWERFGKLSIGFIGYPDEHKEFVRRTGHRVDHIPTANLYEAARVIAGSTVCVGNQTCLAAIAHGLRHPMILEICGHEPVAVFQYDGLFNAYDADFTLPTLTKEKHARVSSV